MKTNSLIENSTKPNYIAFGTNKHYINSGCILTGGRILKNGKTYYLATAESELDSPVIKKVKLIDAYYRDGIVYVFLLNLDSDNAYILDIPVIENETDCDFEFFICDIDKYQSFRELITVKLYCNKDDADNKIDSNMHETRSDNKNDRNALLEFDY